MNKYIEVLEDMQRHYEKQSQYRTAGPYFKKGFKALTHAMEVLKRASDVEGIEKEVSVVLKKPRPTIENIADFYVNCCKEVAQAISNWLKGEE